MSPRFQTEFMKDWLYSVCESCVVRLTWKRCVDLDEPTQIFDSPTGILSDIGFGRLESAH
ncbi:hypothetical protein C7453_101658 [Gluconacetobacter liquefaciens]|uniref:Uncharacterized protein n=1 Tax=Gluconacetobacter liquefaciens TaxID=89584 RepID=A0A370GCQ5_GLULI|nr:hypothetical protein C7453_101658 [Gluconacetobacter liquefaciens]